MDQAGKELALCLLDSLLKSKGQGSADNPSTPEDLQRAGGLRAGGLRAGGLRAGGLRWRTRWRTAEVAVILCQKTVVLEALILAMKLESPSGGTEAEKRRG